RLSTREKTDMAPPRRGCHRRAMAESHELGRRAEAAVADHLDSTGWSVLAMNWRFRHKEIDVIARRGELIAFIEVKCRSGSRFGQPAEAITLSKRRDLAAAAHAWICRNRPSCAAFRFDLCSVTVRPDGRL